MVQAAQHAPHQLHLHGLARGPMSAHTPGPWVFDVENVGCDYNIGFGVTPATSGTTLAHIPCRANDGNAEANARLIAAAPELLWQLKKAVPAIAELHSQ